MIKIDTGFFSNYKKTSYRSYESFELPYGFKRWSEYVDSNKIDDDMKVFLANLDRITKQGFLLLEDGNNINIEQGINGNDIKVTFTVGKVR